MIEVRIDQLLKARGRTFYWLAKETGVSHTTLWRLKKGKHWELTSSRWKSSVKHWIASRAICSCLSSRNGNLRERDFEFMLRADPQQSNYVESGSVFGPRRIIATRKLGE
jgi:hypothetical protein